MQTLGRYRVLRQVGSGGMGVVFQARDDTTGELVAIKRLHAADGTPRFAREADALARLDHPAIVAFRERLTDPLGRPALVMEWVDGEALDARLRREGPLPLAQAITLTRALCAALSYAHAQGVIHRDLKPSNLLLDPHRALKVTDFGLSKVFDHTALPERISLTKTGDIMGTPGYMPPEQATGDKAAMGPCSDVYGVGATLYALLTGQAPFRAPTVLNVLNKLLTEPPFPPSSLRPEVPPALDAIVLRCLAKDPGERYLSVDALDEALATWEQTPAGGRSRAAALAACAVVVAGAGLAAWVTQTRRQPADLPAHPGDPTPRVADTEAADDPAAQRAICEQALDAGRLDDAVQAAERAIALDASQWASHACLARAHHERCDDTSAIAAWLAAVERAPAAEQPLLQLELGRSYRNRKRLDDAQHAFEAGRARRLQAADEDDGLVREFDAELVLVEVLGSWSQGPVRAGKLLEQSIARKPTALAHELRSSLRTQAKDLESALADLDAAVDLAVGRRQLSAAYGQRAMCSSLLGRPESSLADLRQAIELAPPAAEPTIRLGTIRVLRQRGASAVALELIEGLLTDTPDDAELHAARAAALRDTGQLEAAAEAYAAADRFATLSDSKVQDWFGLLLELRRLDAARRLIDRSLARAPNNAQRHLERATLFGLLGDGDRALADLETAERLEPQGAAGAYWRCLAAALAGRPEQAATAASEIPIEARPFPLRIMLSLLVAARNDPELTPALTHVAQGISCGGNGHVPESEAAFEQASRAVPDRAEPPLLRGFYRVRRGAPGAVADLQLARDRAERSGEDGLLVLSLLFETEAHLSKGDLEAGAAALSRAARLLGDAHESTLQAKLAELRAEILRRGHSVGTSPTPDSQ